MRCLVAKCSATTCPYQHKCCRCSHWKLPSGFGTWGTGRKLMCMTCSEKKKVYDTKKHDADPQRRKISNAKSNPKSNPISNLISNAKTSATKLANKIAYEQKTMGDKIDISDERRAVAEQQCIETIKARIKVYEEQYPKGFSLAIYGTSTGSLTVEHEGRNQFTGRGYGMPPIVT